MTNHTAIKVDSISKVYPLYNTQRDRLKEALHPFRKSYHTDFYALRNISFEIEKGESVGIVGQNGSGKSTLLKILSKVLTPTSGSFNISGRVISLLELGSGFNPHLTGIENIYFYGTLLGFTKKSIEAKFDQILSFADIGQHAQQPLKTYSSGMRSRLAFAVASNVDPDILILDEVLAVGDLRFKQKCYRVMDSLIDRKRTVILVSHDTGAITNFCNKTIWLDKGEICEIGASVDVVKRYVGFMTYGMETKQYGEGAKKGQDIDNKTKNKANPKETTKIKWIDVSKCDSFGDYGALIKQVAICFKDTYQDALTVEGGEWLSLYTKIHAADNIVSPGIGIKLKDKRGNGIFTVNNYLYNKTIRAIKNNEELIVRTDFKLPLLTEGKYTITVALTDGDQQNHIQHHWIHDAMVITLQHNEPQFKRTSNILVIDKADYKVEIVK